MKTIITFFVALFTTLAFSNLSAQAQKTLVRTLDTKGTSAIVADLNGKITVKEGDGQFARITTTIDVANFGTDILQRLVEAGRYNLETTINAEGQFVVFMPSIEKRVIIKGVDLMDSMHFEIELPKGAQLIRKSESPAAQAM